MVFYWPLSIPTNRRRGSRTISPSSVSDRHVGMRPSCRWMNERDSRMSCETGISKDSESAVDVLQTGALLFDDLWPHNKSLNSSSFVAEGWMRQQSARRRFYLVDRSDCICVTFCGNSVKSPRGVLTADRDSQSGPLSKGDEDDELRSLCGEFEDGTNDAANRYLDLLIEWQILISGGRVTGLTTQLGGVATPAVGEWERLDWWFGCQQIWKSLPGWQVYEDGFCFVV